MLQDVVQAINWVFENISLYGGDINNISIVGQSAGAHLTALALLLKAKQELDEGIDFQEDFHTGSVLKGDRRFKETIGYKESQKKRWSNLQIKKFVGVSGPYDLATHVGHFHNRGLPKYLLYSIFQGELSRFSPTRVVPELRSRYQIGMDPSVPTAASVRKNSKAEENREERIISSSETSFSKSHKDVDNYVGLKFPFPRTFLLHGTGDVTMPFEGSVEFANCLKDANVEVKLKLYAGKTHTDCILEDLFLGDNCMLDDVVKIILDERQIFADDDEEEEEEEECGEQKKEEEQQDDEEVVRKGHGQKKGNKEEEEEDEDDDEEEREKWHGLTPAGYPKALVQLAKRVNPFWINKQTNKRFEEKNTICISLNFSFSPKCNFCVKSNDDGH